MFNYYMMIVAATGIINKYNFFFELPIKNEKSNLKNEPNAVKTKSSSTSH